MLVIFGVCPNITGAVTGAKLWTNSGTAGFRSPSGCFSTSGTGRAIDDEAGVENNGGATLNLSATKSSAIYGKSSNVQPPSAQVLIIIKV